MPGIDTGDTAFILIAAAMVLFMTPGLALFYGGLVRSKNVLSTTMHSFFAIGIVTVVWAVIGYTIAFGTGAEGALANYIGGFDAVMLNGVIGEASGTIPESVFMIFQGMFAIITAALITGAFAERIKFGAYVAFTALWVILVYSPLAHWVWGGGWLAQRGALDFAGGTVVHIASAAAALAGAIVIGRRKGWGKENFRPHNLPMTVLGAGILWFGWFGFNAGSALAADGLAGSAFVATQLSAAAAMLSWLLLEKIQHGKATTLGAASGAVAGLVAITPAAGFVEPGPALIIGLIGGALCYFGVNLKSRFGFDDALDVVGIHGIGGITGALLTGVFATTLVNEGGADGLLNGGGWGIMLEQTIGVVATIAFSFGVSFILFKGIDLVMGLRVSEEDEEVGLDQSEHAETGYEL
jgi:Amt family ammonium transporter